MVDVLLVFVSQVVRDQLFCERMGIGIRIGICCDRKLGTGD